MIRASVPNRRPVVIAVALIRALLSGRMLRGFLPREFVANSSRAFAGIEVLGILQSGHVVTNSQLIAGKRVNPGK